MKKGKKPIQMSDKKYQKWAFLFTLPNLLLFIIFFVFPAVLGIFYSFTNYNGLKMMDFIGIKNYTDLFTDPNFYKVLSQTLFFVLLTVPLTYAFSLLVGILMTTKYVKYKTIPRILIYWPTLISTVLIGLTWRWIFGEKFGLINYILQSIGLEQIRWATNGTAAFITTIIAVVWGSTGFYMLMFVGGIENIDASLYEAAGIDGASDWKTFLHITLPQLRPISFLVIVLCTINSFKEFATTVTLTNGGPGMDTTYLIQYIYQTGFDRLKVGYASAASMVLFFILLILSIVQFRINNRKEVD